MCKNLHISKQSRTFVAFFKIDTIMTRQATVKTIEQNDNVSLFSICFDGSKESEFEKFLLKFQENAKLNADYQSILVAINRIVAKGALERFFRPEGKMNDDVCALSLESKRLRLYCLRISDQILFVGNGGEKTTRTYQENQELSGYVMDLQKFDQLLRQAQEYGEITIEKNFITGIENQIFEL